MELSAFNTAPRAEAERVVRACADIDTWVDAVVGGRPYPSLAALVVAADEATSDWSATDVEQALAHHPRLGERMVGEGVEQAMSDAEQAAVTGRDLGSDARIAEGNRAYERRFGRVFLIRAAGRSSAEILTELSRRLVLDPEEECAEVTEQLRQIALLRLGAAVTETVGQPA